MRPTGLIKFVLLSVVMFVLFAVLVKPQIIANIYNKTYPEQFNPVDVTTLPDVKVVAYERDYKVYRFNESSADVDSPVVVFISGGFFVRSLPELDLLNRLSKRRAVVAFTYPVRFAHTIQQMRDYVRRVICDYVTVVHPTKEVVLVAYSAGAFLALMFAQDNHEQQLGVRIVKFIGVNGFYGSDSVSSVLLKAPSLYYVQEWGRVRPPMRVHADRVHVLTTTRDFVRGSSERMASANLVTAETFDGDHVTFLKTNLPASAAMVDRVNHHLLDVDV